MKNKQRDERGLTAPDSSDGALEHFFVGRSVLVSGGGRGIGRALAERFASFGASVHIIARTNSAIETAQSIRDRQGNAAAHVGSVADEDFCHGVIDQIIATEGAIDVLVNAAAVLGPSGKFTELSMSQFAETLATNLLGTCNLVRWALPEMEKRSFGRIINFAGGGAAYSYPLFTPYAASKAAIVRLTEIVADEITTADVTINVIAPGAVETDTLREVRRRGGEVRTPASMDEALELVTFLAGPRASGISGRFIHIRDDYRNPDLFASRDMLKLRRVERR